MLWRVEVYNKERAGDSGIRKDIEDLGIKGVESVEVVQVYIIEGDVRKPEIKRIASELLTDPVTQDFDFETFRDCPRKGLSLKINYMY